MEKGIVKVRSIQLDKRRHTHILQDSAILYNNLFPEERENGQLKFRTSVFHAYVHRWLCQLEYNPRLNEGWGLSDGEGEERIWWTLSPLIAYLRYSSSQHRLDAIHLKAHH